MRMRKDLLPLYIAISSGGFTLLTTIADNLTSNLNVVVKESKSLEFIQVKEQAFDPGVFLAKNFKPILFGSISLIAVVVFIATSLKKKSRKK